jgi:hypothetical protein
VIVSAARKVFPAFVGILSPLKIRGGIKKKYTEKLFQYRTIGKALML